VLDWFGGEASVPDLIQRKKYDKAERLLRKEFEAGRRDAELRLQLADVIALSGRGTEAVAIYIGLADEFARSRQAPKAIAILKKIERAAPGRGDVADRLAALIGDHGAGAAAAASPPPAPAPEPVAEPEFDLELALDPTANPRAVEAPSLPQAAPPPAAGGIDPAFASPLFGDFSREDLLVVMSSLRFLTFEAGDIIVGDGEPGDSLFVISSGRVKAFVKGAEGRYRETREMGDGDFFGEIALLYGRPRTATVTAAESCELLELERATVESLAATRPRVREILESFCTARVGAGS
jgi:cAMP-dependent protein kinase regulator